MMRFRPRFTLRTLAIVVTLICAYFGAWEFTRGKFGPESPAPFVKRTALSVETTLKGSTWISRTCYVYHFWFCGHLIKLPLETDEIDYPTHIPPPWWAVSTKDQKNISQTEESP